MLYAKIDSKPLFVGYSFLGRNTYSEFIIELEEELEKKFLSKEICKNEPFHWADKTIEVFSTVGYYKNVFGWTFCILDFPKSVFREIFNKVQNKIQNNRQYKSVRFIVESIPRQGSSYLTPSIYINVVELNPLQNT